MPNAHDRQPEGVHIVSTWIFFAVWAALVTLLGMNIWVASLNLGELSTIGSLIISSVQGLLVLFFFMHLKYEAPVFKIMALIAVLTLMVIILLTFSDVWYRR